MKKKNILFVLPGFTYGGTVFSTLNILRSLDKSKYLVTILAMNQFGPVRELYKDYNILEENVILASIMGRVKDQKSYIRKIEFLFLKLFNRLLNLLGTNLIKIYGPLYIKKLCSKNHFDYVASCQEGAATHFVSFFKGCKKIAWFRSEYHYYMRSQSLYDYEKQMYKDIDDIICVSKVTRDGFIDYFPQFASKTHAIHNIQDVENIVKKSIESIDDSRFSNNSFTIVSIGRFAPEKRFLNIPGIAKRIKDKGLLFNWYIIGDGNNINYKQTLISNINSCNVQDCVVLLGNKINPYPYIANSDLLVNTSSVEACPRVVIEAKILKTPVICADFNSAKEFVSNDVDGFIDSIENLHLPIINMISNPQEYNRIKEYCNMFIMDNDLIMNQLEKIFS